MALFKTATQLSSNQTASRHITKGKAVPVLVMKDVDCKWAEAPNKKEYIAPLTLNFAIHGDK
jgi:hypothetical protein